MADSEQDWKAHKMLVMDKLETLPLAGTTIGGLLGCGQVKIGRVGLGGR